MLRAIWLTIVTSAIVAVVISSRFFSMAQFPGPAEQARSQPIPKEKSPDRFPNGENLAADSERPAPPVESRAASAGATLQDALLRPYNFPFSRPTSLTQVCAHLKQTLKAPVVIDLAALDRQNVEPEDPVQLELEGVRLKTGLKLLLDQVGLTYRIEAEDNLMIITDAEGAQEPGERIWAELRALHRDLHDVQDSLDELRAFFGDDRQSGPKVRKPTIIEEMPEGALEGANALWRNPATPPRNPPANLAKSPKVQARRLAHGSRRLEYRSLFDVESRERIPPYRTASLSRSRTRNPWITMRQSGTPSEALTNVQAGVTPKRASGPSRPPGANPTTANPDVIGSSSRRRPSGSLF